MPTGLRLVSLENLSRDLRGDFGDVGQVEHFTDVVLAVGSHPVAPERLFWALEPNNFAETPPYRVAVSPLTDRVLSDYAADFSWLRWVTTKDLQACECLMNMPPSEHSRLRKARLKVETVDGATVLWLDTDFPSKASLILAPSLRDIVGPYIGWPVQAVAPDRAFVYLWAASRRELIPKLGRIVVREYGRAPYSLTMEVFEIDEAVEAIGVFNTAL